MRHITIRLEDDRFDDIPADTVPALIFDMIKHDLWHLTDPWVHVSEIDLRLPIVKEGDEPDEA